MISATSSSQANSARSGAVIATVVACGIAASVQVGKAAIATPMLQADFGVDLGAAGWLTAVFAILGLFGGIPVGAIVASAGDRRILILGLMTVLLGAAIGASASSFSVLLASRVLEGLGFLLIIVAGPAILQRLVAARQRDMAFALWSCFMPAGMAIAMLAGPLFGDWRTLWWASAGLAAFAIAMTFLVVPGVAASASTSWRGLAADALAVLRRRGPVLLATCFALYSLMFFALFSFLPVLLVERMEVAHGAAGLLSALATGANIIGNLAAGTLLTRGVGRSALIAGASLVMGLSALGIFLPVLADTPTFLLCLLFSAVGGLIPATLLSSVPLLAPSIGLAPVVVGLMMQGSNLGQLVGPVAVGRVIEAYGWPAAAGVVLTSALVAVFSALALRPAFKSHRQETSAPRH